MHDDVLGPLHGVPVTVKDSFDMAGTPTWCGSRFRLDHIAKMDQRRLLVCELAVILGKTNTPEFLNNYETDNYLVGRTNNPWDLARTAGGSSGGESAAIASYCSAGGIGSDGGGSIVSPLTSAVSPARSLHPDVVPPPDISRKLLTLAGCSASAAPWRGLQKMFVCCSRFSPVMILKIHSQRRFLCEFQMSIISTWASGRRCLILRLNPKRVTF